MTRSVVALAGLVGSALILAVAISGCEKKPAAVTIASTSSSDPAAAAKETLVSRGRTIYQTTCIACHNPDPRQKGAIGPDVYGSSQELLTYRIMESKYPPGYKPKGNGKIQMPVFPQFKNDIDAIHAYLNN